MGTEILRPQDCLAERIRSSPTSSAFVPRRRSNRYYYNYNNNYYNNTQGYLFNYNFTPSRKQPVVVRSDHQRKPRRRRSSSVDDVKLKKGDHFTVEKKAVLRRGESFEKIRIAGKSDVLYAGSAFAVSPAPSSLPLPSFSRTTKNSCKHSSVDDSATRGLRRLLRLNM